MRSPADFFLAAAEDLAPAEAECEPEAAWEPEAECEAEPPTAFVAEAACEAAFEAPDLMAEAAWAAPDLTADAPAPMAEVAEAAAGVSGRI